MTMTVEERLAEDIKVETKTDIARHGLIVYGHIENRHRHSSDMDASDTSNISKTEKIRNRHIRHILQLLLSPSQ